MAADVGEEPLDAARHIRYFQRCFRTVLPYHYTSNDSNRLSLGFFIVAALDLLSPSSPTDLFTSQDRNRLSAWIHGLQHPHGGFCGSPHHVMPDGHRTRWDHKTETWVARDPANANIAATGFALLCLAIVAEGDGTDAFYAVDRVKTLTWLKKLQREDGSFGEVLTDEGHISGGRDMRYCYLAVIIRYALGGGEGDPALDFDVDALVRHIRRGQTFDGGVGESSTHESHSGYAYCAVAALSLLDSSASTDPNSSATPNRYLNAGIPSIPSLIHFLVNRQFVYLEPDNEDEEDEETPNHPLPDLSSLSLSDAEPQLAGFNGRLNKVPDTCYTWWNSGTLSLLGQEKLISRAAARRFLMQKTQHRIGGFAKHPDQPPDIYHAYLGLAALATIAGPEGEPGLAKFHPALCISEHSAAKLIKAKESIMNPDTDSEGGDADCTVV